LEIDLHTHTIVSDGSLKPGEILALAARASLREVSITDHDAIGAYRHFGDLRAEADRLGVALLPGIELDSFYRGEDAHVLGYGIDLENGPLNAYLEEVQALRRTRMREQMARLNELFGQVVIEEAAVFFPWRDTCMMPHLIKPLLALGRFDSYRQAKDWFKVNVPVATRVPKPEAAEVIRMIRAAGGWSVLAHPGFCLKDMGLPLEEILRDFKAWGLDGVEVDYRYRGSREFPTLEDEQAMVEEARAAAARFGLRQTRGSDCHLEKEFLEFNKY